VNEDVLATILGGDKAEALVTEEFDRAVVRHLEQKLSTSLRAIDILFTRDEKFVVVGDVITSWSAPNLNRVPHAMISTTHMFKVSLFSGRCGGQTGSLLTSQKTFNASSC
jgi:hypothetical protein